MRFSSFIKKEALTLVAYPEKCPRLLKHYQQTSSDTFLHESVLSTEGMQTWGTKTVCVWEGVGLFLLPNQPDQSHFSLAGLTAMLRTGWLKIVSLIYKEQTSIF